MNLALSTQKKLIRRTLDELFKRDLDTDLPLSLGMKHSTLMDRSVNPSLWLVRFKRREYDSNPWVGDREIKVQVAYLCGREDGQDWAVRVPYTKTTIKDALDWLTPAAVKKARAQGKEVHRQGDMYFIPFNMPHNELGALARTRHEVQVLPKEPHYATDTNLSPITALRISHPQHPAIILDGKKAWRAVPQKQLGPGGSRAEAD